MHDLSHILVDASVSHEDAERRRLRGCLGRGSRQSEASPPGKHDALAALPAEQPERRRRPGVSRRAAAGGAARVAVPDLLLTRLLDPGRIDPRSSAKHVWDWVVILFVLATTVFTPLDLSFFDGDCSDDSLALVSLLCPSIPHACVSGSWHLTHHVANALNPCPHGCIRPPKGRMSTSPSPTPACPWATPGAAAPTAAASMSPPQKWQPSMRPASSCGLHAGARRWRLWTTSLTAYSGRTW